MSNFAKTPKIGHFLKFLKGGIKGKSLKKQAELAGSKNTLSQIPSSINQYALKVQSTDNIVPQTAALKVPAIPSNGQFRKDTKIGHFLKFFKGGTKGKSLKKQAELAGSKNTLPQIPSSINQYALKVQSSDNIVPQTAALKVPAIPSNGQFRKDTKIGHFLKFFKGGTKAKSLKKQAELAGSKNTLRQIPSSINWYALKLESSDNIVPQTTALKVPAIPSNGQFCKDTKIGHFLKFFKGGTKGKSLKKQAELAGSKNSLPQIPSSISQYALKVQSADNIVPQTAALKVPAILSNGQFRKDTKIGHFLKFFKGGTKGKSLKKQAELAGSKNPCRKSHPQLISMFKGGTRGKSLKNQAELAGSKNTLPQIPSSSNQYALNVQSSDNIVPQTAALKGPAIPSNGQFCKDTKIGHFLKFFKGGTKGKSLKKQAELAGSKNTLPQIPSSINQYALNVQSSDNIVPQTAALKGPAIPSNGQFCKDTKIGHFLKFFKGGTKGKSLKKQDELPGSKNTLLQIPSSVNQYALKVQSSDNIVPQTAALKVPAIPSNGQFRKDTKIGHFLQFFKGWTKGKSLEKQAELAGSKNTLPQIPSSINQYALKVQSSDNIVPQTAALKVPAIPSNGQFRKDTKIGHFLKFFKGGTKGKSLKKQAELAGSQNSLPQIPSSINQYVLKVQSSDNIVPQTAALKVPTIPSVGQFRKDTKIGHFLKFFKGGTKGKSLKKEAALLGSKNTLPQIPSSINQYALKVQSSDNIVPQTAALKVPAIPSNSQFGKDTTIGHFLKFFKGGIKGKSLKKQAELAGSKNTLPQIPSSINQYALKVQSSDNIVPQTAALKVPAIPSNSQFGKDTKISHFLKFFKGGTKGKSLKKQAELAGSKNTLPQIPFSINQYALKVQSSDNIVPQTAALKVPAIPSNGQFPKDTKIGHFLKFFKGGTKGKQLKEQAELAGSKNTLPQIPSSINQYALKVQSSDNIVPQTAALKVPAIPSVGQFRKDTKIGNFLKFFKGGTKGKSLKKESELSGSKNTLPQIPSSINQYALKVQSSDNIVPQTAALKVPAIPSNGQFCKDTKIGHFFKFFKGGTKGKSLKKQAELAGSKNTLPQIPSSINQYALKVQSSENIVPQTAALKVPAIPGNGKFRKDTKIGHFLKFFKGGTKGKSLKKQAELAGSKNTLPQIPSSINQYALKVQSSDNIVPQTAALKVPAIPSNSQFGKDTKIGHFLKFFKGGTKGKSLKKQAELAGTKNTLPQIPSSINQYALKVQSSDNIVPQTVALKVPAIPSNGQFRKDTKMGHFLKFFKGGTKGKSLKRQAELAGSKNTLLEIPSSINQYALKVQSLDNIVPQTAALKVPAIPSNGQFRRDTKIGNFQKFFKGGTKGKSLKKQAELAGSKNTLLEIPSSINQYALKVQSLDNIVPQTAALKVPPIPSNGQFRRDTKSGNFQKFFKGGTKGKSLKKQAKLAGPKNTLPQIPS